MALKFLKIPLILFCTLFSLCTSSLAEQTEFSFDIPSQDVAPALDRFARLTDLSVIYKPQDIRPATTQALSGTYLPDQALRIMLEGTGLTSKRTGEGTFAVVRAAVPDKKPRMEELPVTPDAKASKKNEGG